MKIHTCTVCRKDEDIMFVLPESKTSFCYKHFIEFVKVHSARIQENKHGYVYERHLAIINQKGRNRQ